MILVIPSLDIKNGKVVQRIKAPDKFEFYYKELSENPIDLCMLWRSENAKTLHINDLDGTNPDSPNKQIILDIIECIDIPVILSSRSNSIDELVEYLEKGIFRVSLSQIPITDPDITKKLLKEFGASRITFHAIADNDELLFWGKESGHKLSELIEILQSIGAKRLIYGDKEWIGNNQPVNFEKLKNIAQISKMNISLFCGVPNYITLKKLSEYERFGIDSVIISKSLYENNFPCQEIWRTAETL
ncbi:MAG: HisA/HisF-related TIM barrel protein [Candidatus Kapaibacteriota bacterium]